MTNDRSRRKVEEREEFVENFLKDSIKGKSKVKKLSNFFSRINLLLTSDIS